LNFHDAEIEIFDRSEFERQHEYIDHRDITNAGGVVTSDEIIGVMDQSYFGNQKSKGAVVVIDFATYFAAK
jgi:hypothetical protein